MKYFDRSQILSVFNDEGETVFRKRAENKKFTSYKSFVEWNRLEMVEKLNDQLTNFAKCWCDIKKTTCMSFDNFV